MAKKGRRTTSKPETLIGNALANEHERGCVLVGGAYVEYRLEQLLRVRLAATPGVDGELIKTAIGGPDDSQALLFSGWAKASVLHLFGVIDREWYKIYNEIRKLRNHFAHTAGEVRLDDESMENLVGTLGTERLALIQRYISQYTNDRENSMWTGFAPSQEFSSHRLTFMHSCLMLNTELNSLITGIAGMTDPGSHVIGRIQPRSKPAGLSQEKE